MRTAAVSVPRSIRSWPRLAISSSTASRSFTPRWSNETATFTSGPYPTDVDLSQPPRMPHNGRERASGTGPAVPRRLRALRGSREVGAPDVGYVRRRPDGGAAGEPPALRLRRARPADERPVDLLQGARLDAPLRDVQGRRRGQRRGAADVPNVRQHARG